MKRAIRSIVCLLGGGLLGIMVHEILNREAFAAIPQAAILGAVVINVAFGAALTHRWIFARVDDNKAMSQIENHELAEPTKPKSGLGKWLDFDSIIPDDHGCEGRDGYPRFFAIECMLLLPAGLLAVGGGILAVVFLASAAGLIWTTQPTNWGIGWFAVVCLLLGALLFQTIQLLSRRHINNEQYEWLLSVYERLGLPRPTRDMTKQDLRPYVTEAYRILSQNKAAALRDSGFDDRF